MTASYAAHARHSVLVVDDEAQVAETLRAILSRDGFDVLTAHDAAEGLAVVQETVPCMILLDVAMPGMNGFDLCRRIKQSPRLAPIPVALVTASVGEADVREGLAAGAVDYIRKPFDADEIRMRVRAQIRLHEALIEQERLNKKLSAISSAVEHAIIMMDGAGLIAHWNEGAERMFGYTRAEALGRNVHHLLAPTRFHDAHDKAFPHFRATGEGPAVGKTLELTGLRRSGEEFPVDLSLGATQIDGAWCAVAIVRDVSARKQMETELGQARKLEAVGQLAAGIAHEINTPTQYVGDSVHFLTEALDGYRQVAAQCRRAVAALEAAGGNETLVSEIRQTEADVDLAYLDANVPGSIDRSLRGLARIAKIVRAMKEFAHPDQGAQSPADLNQALQNTLIIAEGEYKDLADVALDLQELPPVLCHLGDLNQVFLNVIVNAAHALREVAGPDGTKGKLLIKTLREGDAVRIDITDTGAGIPEHLRDRIFEPFFTTKALGKGTGQGLSLARSIVVNEHGGRLTFVSEVGQGTTFTIRLPIGGKPAFNHPADVKGLAVRGGS